MSDVVDMVWEIRGAWKRARHAWRLYAALKGVAPGGISSPEVRVGPVDDAPQITLRCPVARVGELLAIEGAPLQIGRGTRDRLCLVDPVVRPLRPAHTLTARVLFSHGKRNRKGVLIGERPPVSWWSALIRQFVEVDVDGTAELHVGERVRLPLKRGHWHYGWHVTIAGLTPARSVALQATQIGARRHMGCGFFAGDPTSPRRVYLPSAEAP